jgi:hypothetical protein
VRVGAAITKVSSQQALADMVFLDAAGEVVARIERYECVFDHSLNQAFRRNRLADEVVPVP